MADRPSVGRVVHYVAYGTPGGEFKAGVCRAAIISAVGQSVFGMLQFDADGQQTSVSLVVLNPTGLFFNINVPYDAEKAPGTWHWPERI